MNLKTLIILLISAVNLSYAITNGEKYLTVNNCMNCAKSQNYFCQDTNKSGKTNPWEIQCCHDGSSNSLCQTSSGENRKCSAKFSASKGGYFGDCPDQSKSTCGLQYNYDGLNIYANENKTSFSYEWLRYTTKYWKTVRYSACSYKIMNPPGGYDGGNIYFQVTKLEDGIKLYIQSEDGTTIPDQLVSASSKVFKVANGKALKVTAVPSKDSFNTTFDFEYWTDGTKIPDAPIWAKMNLYAEEVESALEATGETPMLMTYIIAGSAALLCLIVICVGIYCRGKARQQEKIGIRPVVLTEEND